MNMQAKAFFLLVSFIGVFVAIQSCKTESVVRIHKGKPVHLAAAEPVAPVKMLPVDITFILDRSGSMGKLTEQVIVSYNDFITEQQTIDGEAVVSLIQFDDKYEPNYAGVAIEQAGELTANSYEPRGSTALFDAIGRSIIEAKARIQKDSADVVFVITTDGLENASKEFSGEQIRDMIADCECTLGWHFMYLAANADAFQQHKEMGLASSMCMEVTDTAEGWCNSQKSMSSQLLDYRISRESTDLEFEE